MDCYYYYDDDDDLRKRRHFQMHPFHKAIMFKQHQPAPTSKSILELEITKWYKIVAGAKSIFLIITIVFMP